MHPLYLEILSKQELSIIADMSNKIRKNTEK